MKDCPICYEPRREWTQCHTCKNQWCFECYDRMLSLTCPFCRQPPYNASFRVTEDGEFEWTLEYTYSLIFQNPANARLQISELDSAFELLLLDGEETVEDVKEPE